MGKANGDRDHRHAGRHRQAGGPGTAPQQMARIAVDGALGEDADRGTLPQACERPLKGAALLAEQRFEPIEKSRPGLFVGDDDGAALPIEQTHPGHQHKVPVGQKVDWLAVAVVVQQGGDQDRLVALVVVEHGDEGIVAGTQEGGVALDLDDLASGDHGHQAQQDPVEPAVLQMG